MAERRSGLTWFDGVLLVLALLGVADLLRNSYPPQPFLAVVVVLVTAVGSISFVCSGKEIYRWTVRYLTAFLFAMLFATVSLADRVFEVPRSIELPILLLVASMPVLSAFTKSDRTSVYRWLAFALCLGLMVAMFSGSAGAGSSTISWLQHFFDWTLEQAQMSNRVFRKGVHVTFYALMFLSMARAAWLSREKWSVSFLAALIWATGHAAFDETVQGFFDDRTGSFKDYLMDASGMGIAFVVCWLLWGRKGRSKKRT